MNTLTKRKKNKTEAFASPSHATAAVGTIRADVIRRKERVVGHPVAALNGKRKSENVKMKKKEGIGRYEHSEVVNDTEVYYGGLPARKRVSNDAPMAWVMCASCAMCKRRDVEEGSGEAEHQCQAIVTDKGRAMLIGTPKLTRCQRWTPKYYLAMIGKSQGKVDPPGFIRWKADHPNIIGWPEDHGKKKMETVREFPLEWVAGNVVPA